MIKTIENQFDSIIVGSGINSLVAAALLSRKGHKVCVLERNDWLGGCIKTAEITKPGFKHDIFSGFHPLFVTSPAYAELADELHSNGLEYLNTTKPTAVVLPDGRSHILYSSREDNIKAMQSLNPKDADAYVKSMADIEQNTDLIFGLLGSDLWKFSTLKVIVKAAWSRGLAKTSSFFGMSFDNCRHWLEASFTSAEIKACFAPWILHTGLGPDSPLSGLMGKLIAFSLEAAGMPVVKGGSENLVLAFKAIIEKNGGTLLTQCHVQKVLVEHGKATGVLLESGVIYHAKKAVICNVTPTQLYGSLLDKDHVPPVVKQEADAFSYGCGDMQIHIALDEIPQWENSDLNDVAMIHLSSGIDSVSKAINEAQRGYLPSEATVVVAQPTALDPSRAPKGKAILWLQLQELPYHIKGDVLGEISIPEDGLWDDITKEAYADRIIARLAKHIPNLQENILERVVLSPRDLEASNINLVNGDPYSGSCGIEQFMLWRPLKSTKNHTTPIKQLYHIGASTHPGPGLGGTSGFLVAQDL